MKDKDKPDEIGKVVKFPGAYLGSLKDQRLRKHAHLTGMDPKQFDRLRTGLVSSLEALRKLKRAQIEFLCLAMSFYGDYQEADFWQVVDILKTVYLVEEVGNHLVWTDASEAVYLQEKRRTK